MPKANSFLSDLDKIMLAIAGLKSDLVMKINTVNAQVNNFSYGALQSSYAWGNGTPDHDPSTNAAMNFDDGCTLDMGTKEDDNVFCMLDDNNILQNVEYDDRCMAYSRTCDLLGRAGQIVPLQNSEELERWYECLERLFSSMGWKADDTLTADQLISIINAWLHEVTKYKEEEFSLSTQMLFHRLTSHHLDTRSAKFHAFTDKYNAFCAQYNFPPSKGFGEDYNKFFREYKLNSGPQAPKTVCFESLSPIESLTPIMPSPPTDDFPALQDSSFKPVSYASATSRRHNRSKVTGPPQAQSNATAQTVTGF